MRIGIFNDEDQIASQAADRIIEVYRAKPDFVLGLATGSSPLGLYAELVRRHQAGEISFKRVRSYNLDEYVGLPRDHYEGYANFIRRNLVGLVDMPEGAAHGPDGWCDDLEAGARAYDVLTEQTRRDNARFFDGDIDAVPTHCVTQGLGTIMDSRAHVFIATGEGKADAVRAMVEGGVTQRWPASVLQHHPDVTVLLDEAAASKLELADFYKEVWAKERAGC